MLKPINKRGQVQSIAPAVLALVFAAIVLVFGLVIVQSIRNTDVVAKGSSAVVTNQTLTTMNAEGETITGPSTAPNGIVQINYVTNASDGLVINSANYTYNANNFTMVALTASNFNGSNWNVSYSYTYGDESYTSANKTIVGLGTFADFWEIIVLAIVIAVVIGLLLVVFGTKRGR